MSHESRDLSILFAAGGTGGHLFPAIAIAEEIRKLRPDARISFVGTSDRIEARVVPERGFDFRTIWVSGFHRRWTVGNLLFPVKALVALLQSFFLIRKVTPRVVVGTGGYVCGPVLIVASLLNVPTVVHESNSYPGVTTRLLASRVSRVFLTFELTKKWLPRVEAGKIELLGNPTRESLGRISRHEGSAYFGLDPTRATLLVFGGSLGAASINAVVEKIADELTGAGIQLIWQTGETGTRREAKRRPKNIWVGDFIDRIEYAYAAADLVLCRSGATTLAELTRLGKPAILVPYPFAAANHQELNALGMVETGAALMIKDSELETKALTTIRNILADNERRHAMHEKSLALGRPEAGRKIAERILELGLPCSQKNSNTNLTSITSKR